MPVNRSYEKLMPVSSKLSFCRVAASSNHIANASAAITFAGSSTKFPVKFGIGHEEENAIFLLIWTFDKAAPWADTDAVLAHIYEYKKGKQKTDISLLGNPIKGGLPRFK
jgi:hypothetical protein